MTYDFRRLAATTTVLYHGSSEALKQLVPDPHDRRTLNSLGIWLTSSEEAAAFYGDHVHVARLPPGRYLEPKSDELEPTFYDPALAKQLGIKGGWDDARLDWEYLQAFRAKLVKRGFKGIVWKNSYIDRDPDQETPHDIYLVFTQKIPVKPLKRQAVTSPLPQSFPEDEIGLLTEREFLELRNPGGKQHPSSAYDFDVEKMNVDYGVSIGEVGSGDDRYRATRYEGGVQITQDGKLVAVVHNGIAYYQNPRVPRRLPTQYFESRKNPIDLDIKSMKRVKYLAEVVPLVSSTAKRNAAQYPVVLQHIIVKGEQMTVRAEKQPVPNKGVALAILNSRGLKVAVAQNEWGATLLSVAQEYRGKGLGKIIGRYWYEHNPEFDSGGFTSSGEQNALAMWRDRVREFLDRGWYSQLIKDKRITYERVRQILQGVGKRPPPKPVVEPQGVKATGDILVFADDITFVVYDRAFLDEQDDRFIHGFGFFRDSPHVGAFLYRIEYDRAFADFTTKVALQMARDNGDRLYDGEGYHDMLEDPEQFPGVERDGQYLVVTRDLLPVKAMAAKERRTRKAGDPYDEKYPALLEMAESKWS